MLAAFDDHHGIPELGGLLPLSKAAIGGAFALTFVAIRAVIWPVLAYHLTNDCRAVLADGTAHSPPIVYAFLTGLLGLTLLQFFWLVEIARRAPAEISAALSTARRSDAKAA